MTRRISVFFTISIKTGKLIGGAQVVKMYNSTDKEFFAKVKKVYEKAYKVYKKLWSWTSAERKQNNKMMKSYKYVFPYINKSGKLSFVGKVAGVPSDGSGWVRYDATKKKYTIDQEGVYKWKSV